MAAAIAPFALQVSRHYRVAGSRAAKSPIKSIKARPAYIVVELVYGATWSVATVGKVEISGNSACARACVSSGGEWNELVKELQGVNVGYVNWFECQLNVWLGSNARKS